jgi:hypothetical protein
MNGFVKALVLGSLVLGLGCGALAQTNRPEQSILFTNPTGEIVSNALLPAAQAPQPREEFEDPGYLAAQKIADPLQPAQRMLRPMRIAPDNRQDSLEDPNNMRLKSSSEIMGIPTLRDIFGLPKLNGTNDQNQAYQDASTNIIYSDGRSDDPSGNGRGSSPESTWAKMFFSEQGSSDFAVGKAGSSNSIVGGFFDTSSSDGLFHNNKDGNDSAFGQSVFADTVSQPSKLDSALQSASDASSLPADNFTPPPTPAPAPSVFDSGFSSSSPFELPKTETPAASLPQLPTAPVFQNPNSSFSQPVTPSWAPKPPPWAATASPFGTTITPQKF